MSRSLWVARSWSLSRVKPSPTTRGSAASAAPSATLRESLIADVLPRGLSPMILVEDLELVADGLHVEPQAPRGLRLVVAGLLQRLEHQDALGVGEGEAVGNDDAVARGRTGGVAVTGRLAHPQVLGLDGARVRRHEGALDDVAQLPCVPRPVVRGEGRQHLVTEGGKGGAIAARAVREEVRRDQGHVFRTCAQGGNVDAQHVQAIDEVVAEEALL